MKQHEKLKSVDIDRTFQDIDHIGHIPPQAVELEEVILGAMMLESKCIPTVVSLLNPDSFYRTSHGLIYAAICQLYDSGSEVDILTVTEQLRKDANLEQAGGAYAVTNLTARIVSSANVEAHCRVVQEKYISRLVIQISQDGMRQAFDPVTDPFDLLTEMERGITRINEVIASGGNLKPVTAVLNEAEAEARKRETLYNAGKCTGVPTGIQLLDRMTAGWQKGELIILAGRPSMGKTALMLHHAISSGVNVCIYSLEMSSVSLMNRMILSMCDMDAGKFRAGAMTEEDWQQFHIARARLESLNIYIDDNSVVSTRYIKAHSKMMHDRGKCDIIFVDYLQLADMRSEQHGRSREQEVSQAAREFKILAKSLDVPVVLLSQLSRACESRPDKKPLLSDLRESGAIEQDADIVIFCYRPAYYGLLTDQEGNSTVGVGFEIVAKGRNIGVGEIPFRHNDSMTKIYEFKGEAPKLTQQTPF